MILDLEARRFERHPGLHSLRRDSLSAPPYLQELEAGHPKGATQSLRHDSLKFPPRLLELEA